MWKEFNIYGHYKWIEVLPQIVKKYNNTKHRTIKMKPIDVSKKDEKTLLNTVYNHIKVAPKNIKFRVGDHVRISKVRGVFDKKYLANWTTEIFIIKKVQTTNPVTYLLRDSNNQDIQGGFYEEQLQKVKPDVYLVEKILKRKKDKVFVKWLGFSNKHNSWISNSNVI